MILRRWRGNSCVVKNGWERVAIGGNHLANVLIARLGGDFTDRFPLGMPHQKVREEIGKAGHETLMDDDLYDVWCCWNAIMLSVRP